MKWLFVVLAIIVISAIVVHGQKTKAKPDANEHNAANAVKPTDNAADRTIIVVNEQQSDRKSDDHAKNTESYLSRLLSPENLPNIALVVAAFIGIVVAVGTLGTIKRQTILGEKTLVLQQRPRIVVRAFYFSEPRGVGGVYHVPKRVESGSMCSGQFYIENCGGTDARIREIWCETYIAPGLPMKRPYEGKEGSKEEKTLRPGTSTFYLFGRIEPLDDKAAKGINTPVGAVGPQPTVFYLNYFYVLGWIGYTDDLGIYRTTAFCRCYDIARDRFVPVADSDYEYAD